MIGKKTNWKSQKWDLYAKESTTSKIEMSKSHEKAILCVCLFFPKKKKKKSLYNIIIPLGHSVKSIMT